MDDAVSILFGLGLKPEQVNPGQAALRAVIVYVVTLAIVRLGKKRFLGHGSAFDVIVGIIVGSLAGRAVTGNAPLGTSIAGVAVIMTLHWLFSALAVRWHWVGSLVKGHAEPLIRDGVVDRAQLRREHISEEDLAEDLRQKGHAGPEGIREGWLERSGQVSVLARKTPKIVEVQVDAGVQTVRIELS